MEDACRWKISCLSRSKCRGRQHNNRCYEDGNIKGIIWSHPSRRVCRLWWNREEQQCTRNQASHPSRVNGWILKSGKSSRSSSNSRTTGTMTSKIIFHLFGRNDKENRTLHGCIWIEILDFNVLSWWKISSHPSRVNSSSCKSDGTRLEE